MIYCETSTYCWILTSKNVLNILQVSLPCAPFYPQISLCFALKSLDWITASFDLCNIHVIDSDQRPDSIRYPPTLLSQITVLFKSILRSHPLQILRSIYWLGLGLGDVIGHRFEKVRIDHRVENWTSIWEIGKGHRFENWTSIWEFGKGYRSEVQMSVT